MDELALALAVISRTLVGALLLLAGLAKVRRPDAFERTLRAYPALPQFARRSILVIVPASEAALGVALLAGIAPALAGPLAAATLLLFAGATVASFGWNGGHDCGCYGRPTPMTVHALLRRNIALAALALVSATASWSLEPLATAAVLAVFLVSFAVLRPALAGLLPALSNQPETQATDPGRRRFLRVAASLIGGGGLLALTGRANVAEAACYGCETCSTQYIFIACTGGGCASYWVRTRELCSGGCSTCGSWQIQEFCGIPGC